jgi:hypothetical protein
MCNSSDPFGLCSPKKDVDCTLFQRFVDWSYQKTGSETVLNGLAGFDAVMTGLSALFSDPSAGSPAGAAASGFASFRAFKAARGVAGEGMHWHHIVGQTEGNVARFGAETIHSGANLIRVDAATHARISGYYSSKQAFTGGKTVRDWLGGQSLDAQQKFGQQVLRDFGVKR